MANREWTKKEEGAAFPQSGADTKAAISKHRPTQTSRHQPKFPDLVFTHKTKSPSCQLQFTNNSATFYTTHTRAQQTPPKKHPIKKVDFTPHKPDNRAQGQGCLAANREGSAAIRHRQSSPANKKRTTHLDRPKQCEEPQPTALQLRSTLAYAARSVARPLKLLHHPSSITNTPPYI